MSNIVHIEKQNQELLSSFFKNLDSFSQTIVPHSEKPLVRHNETNQMTYVSEGEGYVLIEDKKSYILKGDLIFISKGNTHSFATNSKLGLLHYHWPKELLGNDREVIENCFSGWNDL